jgi:hypothetical protein
LVLERQRERELASLDNFDVIPVAAIALHHALQYHWKGEDLRNIYFSALDGQQLLNTSMSNFRKKESIAECGGGARHFRATIAASVTTGLPRRL